MTANSASRPFWSPDVAWEERPDGTLYIWQTTPLPAYPRCITDRFMDWAARTPDKTWLVERGAGDAWEKTSYAQAARAIRGIGSALVARGLGPERPLLILSGNSVAHALMAVGAQHVGVPSAALAPAYALSDKTHGKLGDIAAQLTPGVIFADDADAFAPAIKAVFGDDIPVVSITGSVAGHETLRLADLIATEPTAAMEAANAAITPETVAKFLFTSGTTGSPKAVIQTQKMLCSNQEIIRNCYTFLQDEPPVVIDWAPWNHTAAGNKVFNMVLYNGGTLYLDDGKPTPKHIGRTIHNLRDVSPTWYFNVPLGYQMLLDALEADADLRRSFFRRLKMLMYAGAGMSQPVFDRLTRLGDSMVEGGVLVATGFGSTETGPFALMCTERQATAGNLGLPAHGVTLKLAPMDGKLEARIKSPSVTPGYWKNDRLSAEAFDEEGFYRFGDAFRLAVPGDPSQGFVFDGRLAENFKLASGTWVAVGPLRAKLTDDLEGLASDVVIAGENREELGALVVPDHAKIRALIREHGLSEAELLRHPRLRAEAQAALAGHVARATGSAGRVMRLLFIDTPLEFDKGEVTDKGSINQRAVLRNRTDLLARLWNDTDPAVIHPAREGAA